MGIVVALTLTFFWPLIVGNRVLYFGDVTLYFQPMLAFQRSELLAGRIPLWNPNILCGTPFVGNPQAWSLYPSSLLLYFLDAGHATGATGVLHILLAAIGTYAFLRIRGLQRASSLFGAVAWAFGGAVVSKMQFPNMAQAAAYLPWLLWGIERVFHRPTVGRGATLGFLLGLAILAAHPQLTLMHLYIAVFWSLCRLRQCERSLVKPILIVLTGAVCAGGALAAGQLLPVVELTRQSVRSALTLPQASRFILPGYASLYNFILPNFYGNPATPSDFVARGNFWESSAYMGKLTFALAIGGMVRLFKANFDIKFWTVIALVSIWLSLGREAYLYSAAFHFLPGVAKFHDPARWLQLSTFGLAVLAAFGFDAILRSLSAWSPLARRTFAFAFVGLNVADLFMYSATLNPMAPASLFAFASPQYNPERPRAYYADEGPLWGRFVSYRTYATQEGELATRFAQSLGPNAATTAGYTLVNGYEPVRPTVTDSRLLKIASASKADQAALIRDSGAQFVIHLDRAINRPAIQPISSPGASARAFESDKADTVEDVAPDLVRVTRGGNRSSGTLTLADTAYPGWHAFANSRELPIATSDLGFRRVSAGSEDETVEFRYNPTGWRLGAFVTLFAFGILTSVAVGSLAAHFLRRRESDALLSMLLGQDSEDSKRMDVKEDGRPLD